jgi:hypothetical protein
MAIYRTLILSAAGAAILLAQQGSVGGPVAGYVFDETSRTLRAIRGIPGAALVGDSLDFGSPLSAAWVSPRLDSALILAVDGTPRFYRLDAGTATLVPVDGLAAPAQAVYSPSGTALALIGPGGIRVYKGLPGTPVAAGTVAQSPHSESAPGGPDRARGSRPGAVAPIALSDDGSYLLMGKGSTIELLGVAGDSRKLTDAGPGALAVFAPGGHDAAVIDARGIALFQDAAGAATVRRLDGIAGVRAADFSADGKRLFLAGASVTSVDTATGTSTPIACDCRPTGLARMGSTFRLNGLGSGPLWLLDAAAEPRIVFVPAPK